MNNLPWRVARCLTEAVERLSLHLQNKDVVSDAYTSKKQDLQCLRESVQKHTDDNLHTVQGVSDLRVVSIPHRQ